MDEELKGIVENMVRAGESEADIALVIKSYKPAVKKKDASESNSESGSLASTRFEQRIQNPSLKLKNKDGSVSTQKMISFEADGNHYAAPTIVEVNGKLKELTEKEAIKYALKNGELKYFKTEKEAQEYANKSTPLDPYYNNPLAEKKIFGQFNDYSFGKQGSESVYDKYKEATTISDEKQAEIAQSVDDEINNKGFWNKVSDIGNNVKNYVTKGAFYSDDPLADEKKQVKKLHSDAVLAAKKNKEEIPPLSDEDLQIKAKELKLAKAVKSQKETQERAFLKSIEESDTEKGKQAFFAGKATPKSEQQKLLEETKDKKSTLEEKDQTLLKKQDFLLNEINLSNTNIANIGKQVKESTAKGMPVSDDLRQQYESEVTKHNELVKDAISSYDEFSENTSKLGDLSDNIDAFKRSYNGVENFIGNADAATTELLGGLSGAADYLVKVKSKVFGANPQDEMAQAEFGTRAKQLEDNAKHTRDNIMKPVSVSDINSPADFGSWIASTAANQLPILAATATGVGGVAAIGVSATGQKYEKMKGEMGSGEENYSDSQLLGIPLAFGAAETVSAAVDLAILKNAGRVVRSATSAERRLMAEGFAQTLKENAGNLLKNTAKGTIYEGADESLTQIAENMLDKYAGDKKDIGIFDGVKDAGSAGAFMGFMLPFGAGAFKTVSEMTNPFSTDTKVQEASAKIVALEKQLLNPNLEEGSRKIITSQLRQSRGRVETLLKSKIDEVSNMPDEQFQEIVKIEKTKANIKSQAREIEADSSIDEDTKDQILKDLRLTFEEQNQRRIDILERGANSKISGLDEEQQIALKDKAARQLMKEQNPDGTRNITLTDGDISKRALKIFNEDKIKAEEKLKATETSNDESFLKQELKRINAPQNLIDAISDDSKLTYPLFVSVGNVFDKLVGAGFAKDINGDIEVSKVVTAFGNRDKVLLHEAVHSGTVLVFNDVLKNPHNYSDSQVKAVNDINDIAFDYNVSTSATAKMISHRLYGTTNVYEFLSEFVSNKDFRKYVGRTSQTKDVNAVNYIWTRILEMFGIKGKIDQEKINNVSKNIDKIFEASAERKGIIKPNSIENAKTTVEDNVSDSGKERIEIHSRNGDNDLLGTATVLKESNGKHTMIGYDFAFNEYEDKNLEKDMFDKMSEESIKRGIEIHSDPRGMPKDEIAQWERLVSEGKAKRLKDIKGDPEYTEEETVPQFKTLTNEETPAVNNPDDGGSAIGDNKQIPQGKVDNIQPANDSRASEGEDVKIPNVDKSDLDALALNIPKSEDVKNYLSGETIEKYENESPSNNQEYKTQRLQPALEHGIKIIEKAKETYGDNYVEDTLNYIDQLKGNPENKALIYVSLENDLAARKLAEPDNELAISKLQDLVRAKSQAFARSSSLAINFGRLRKFAEAGYDLSNITDQFFSSQQLADKAKLEKVIQSDADAINAEAELQESGEEFSIAEPVRKRSAKIVKADIKSVVEKMRKDLIRVAKGDSALSSIPFAAQLAAVTPHVIKLSKLYAELGGMKAKQIIDEIYEAIKESAPDITKEDISGVIKSDIDSKKPKVNTAAKESVKQALIEKGYGRDITVSKRTVNEDGSVTRIKEKRQILDWKKLVGEEGSVKKIRKNVEEVLKEKGFTDAEISNSAKDYEEEYNNLRASIIEKSLNELNNRNAPRKPIDTKSSAKRLSELYNYGLFDKNADEYEKVFHSALGLTPLSQQAVAAAKVLAQSLSTLFNQRNADGSQVSQSSLKHAERVINKQIEDLLSKVAWNESNAAYKAAIITKEWIGLSQRNALVSLPQAVENMSSGYIARLYNKIGFAFDKTDTKELAAVRSKLARMNYSDINLNGALDYDNVNSPFISKTKTMDFIHNASDSQLYHGLVSVALGKAFLESADSMHKSALTEKYFQYNLIKILKKKGVSKSDAVNFVSEQLTGQSLEDAKITAKEIIDKINEEAGKTVIPNNEQSVFRFANDIVREALIGGNKLDLKEVEASFKSAHTAAGFELGHEANNLLSKGLSQLSAYTQGKANKAIKDKDWGAATAYTTAAVLNTNVVSPFAGGGSNWAFLAMQKAGIPTLSTLYWNIRARRSIDLSTEEGMKKLEESLKNQLLARNANTRLVIGAAVSLAAYATLAGTGADDDLYEWLKKNEWTKRYFNKVSPPATNFMLAVKDEKVGEFFGQLMNQKVDAFDRGKIAKKAVDNAFKGETDKSLGAVGELAGSVFGTPIIPWRVIKDSQNIYRGLNGLPQITSDWKTRGLLNGLYKGGMIDYVGLRPDGKDEPENTNHKHKIRRHRHTR